MHISGRVVVLVSSAHPRLHLLSTHEVFPRPKMAYDLCSPGPGGHGVPWWTCHLTACLPAPGVYQDTVGLCPGSWGRWQSGPEVIRISLPAAGNPAGRGWKGGEGLGKHFPRKGPQAG